MSWLQNGRFWVGLGTGSLLLAVGVTYYLQPPSALGLLFDVAAFGAVFISGLFVVSQLVLPVKTPHERNEAFQHLVSYMTMGGGPITFVKDGKLITHRAELARLGYGVALVDAVSAIVIERVAAPARWPAMRAAHAQLPARSAGSPPLVRAHGPGIVFIEPGERIIATLDLRLQSRSQQVRATTLDGIEVGARVTVRFGLEADPFHTGQAPQSPAERSQPIYAYHPTSAFRAVYGQALGEQQAVDWTALPLMVAVECFRSQLSECRLDSLFPPQRGGPDPFADFQARVAQAVVASPVLSERGIHVEGVSVGDPRFPREVLNQRVRSWQAHHRQALIQQAGALQGDIVRIVGQRQSESLRQMFQSIRALAHDNAHPQDRHALTTQLVRALRRVAADPGVRQQLTPEALHVIEQLSTGDAP